MSTQLKLALYRFVALLLAFGGGDAAIQFLNDGRYDWRHLGVVLAGDAIMAFEQYWKSGRLLRDLGLSAADVGTDNPSAPPQTPVATVPPAA